MIRRLLPLLLGVLAACTGNIGDLFSAFPASAFAPEGEGGGGGLPPGAFQAREVGFLSTAQGVTGNVRNIAVANIGAQRIGFLSAATVGFHVVDLTEPDNILPVDKLATVSDAVLDGMPALLAGGAVDDVAVIDNTYLVCIAVGRSVSNSVTVFHIPTLLDRIATSPGDLSDAYVPGTGNIAVDGTPQGHAGGVSGASIIPGQPNVFVVATGGSELGIGVITPGTPGTWAAAAPLVSTSPAIDRFLDVEFGQAAAYAVVAEDGGIALATLGIQLTTPPSVTVVGATQPLTGGFSSLDNSAAAFAGTFPATLARDATGTLYVSEQNGIRIYALDSPTAPIEKSQIFSAGFDIAGLAASQGFLARTNGANLTVYASLAGTTAPVSSFDAAGRRNLGVSLASDSSGSYAFVCTNNNGLRIIQWSEAR